MTNLNNSTLGPVQLPNLIYVQNSFLMSPKWTTLSPQEEATASVTSSPQSHLRAQGIYQRGGVVDWSIGQAFNCFETTPSIQVRTKSETIRSSEQSNISMTKNHRISVFSNVRSEIYSMINSQRHQISDLSNIRSQNSGTSDLRTQ